MEYLELILVGIATGLVSSLLGVGGGFIMTPMLFIIFPSLPGATVIGCSLGVILMNSVWNSILYKRAGYQLETRIWVLLLIGMVLGVFPGAALVLQLSEVWIKWVFSIVVMGLVAAALWPVDLSQPPSQPSQPVIGNLFFGILAGMISAMTGLGGGTVLFPVLVNYFRVPHFKVPAYSNRIMFGGTAIAVTQYAWAEATKVDILSSFQMGQVNFGIILLMFLGSLMGSPLGIRWNPLISLNKRRWSYVTVLFAGGLQVFLKSFF